MIQKLATLLVIAFVVLKLCNVITWNWWWVISPVVFGLILYLVLAFFNEYLNRKL